MKTFLLCVLVSFAVACGGPEGLPGKPGINGQNGRDGRPGADGRDGSGLDSIIYCTGLVRFSSTTIASVNHSVYRFADGSVMATCDADMGNVGGHGTYMWKSGENGANTGACIARSDADSSPTGGYFTFTITDSNAAHPTDLVTYNDVGSVYDGISWSGTCDRR